MPLVHEIAYSHGNGSADHKGTVYAMAALSFIMNK
jgi:hypothetical protein